MRTRYSNTVYHLVCLELSVTNDCKIELKEVGRLTKAQLVESWLALHSRYNFPGHGWAKSYKARISRKVLKNWPAKDFLVADNFPLERGTLSNSVLWKTWQLCKTLGDFLLDTDEQTVGLALHSDTRVSQTSAKVCWSGTQREILALAWVQTH